ncbi:zf-HC2 domain-containing protein [Dyella sp. 20L07]|uniref:zf-HC2 domain-containing protein n=1 Tax=Dyella sp. 20L07 TaxID=3384240 RepID=UPI003D2B1877
MSGRIIKFEGSAHAEADRLLPWWVNGTLTAEEHAKVEQHLAECSQCQREVTWIRSLQEEYVGDRANTASVSIAIRRMRRRVATEALKGKGTTLSAWWQRAWHPGWLIATQAVLILVLGTALLHEHSATYHTLGAKAAEGSTLIVVFDPHASEEQLRKLIRANHARITGGPTETGAYLLMVPDERIDAARTGFQHAKEVTLVERLDAGATP